MVGKDQRIGLLAMLGNGLQEGSGIGNAYHQSRFVRTSQLIQPEVGGLLRKERMELLIDDLTEEELLMGLQMQILLDDPIGERLHLPTALGDNDNVCSARGFPWFTKLTIGQQLVGIVGPTLVGQQNRQAWADIPMLEGIIEQHDLWAFCQGQVEQLLHPPTSVAIDRYHHLRKLLLDLKRFVSDLRAGVCRGREQESPALPFVASAQDSHPIGGYQQPDQVFRMGCLARPADG